MKKRFTQVKRDILTVSWPDSRSTFRKVKDANANANENADANANANAMQVDDDEDKAEEKLDVFENTFQDITTSKWKEFSEPILDFVKPV